jgi:hypothetical protein
MPVNQIVGGNFQDILLNPLTNGYLTFELSTDETVTATSSTQVCSGMAIRIPLDGTGNVAVSPVYNLWPNDALTPTGSYYSVSAYSSKGQLVWGPFPQSVLSTPTPFDIGSWIPGKL